MEEGGNAHKIKPQESNHVLSFTHILIPIVPTTHIYMRDFYCLLHILTYPCLVMNVGCYIFPQHKWVRQISIPKASLYFDQMCCSAKCVCVCACSNMCEGLESCHAFLLNINYLQLWRCVGGEDAGWKEGWVRKINEYMPPFTRYSSPRVCLSGETSGLKRDGWRDRGKMESFRQKQRQYSVRQMDWWALQ